MWSLCGEIWSAMPVQKSVANLAELNIIFITIQQDKQYFYSSSGLEQA